MTIFPLPMAGSRDRDGCLAGGRAGCPRVRSFNGVSSLNLAGASAPASFVPNRARRAGDVMGIERSGDPR